MLGVLVFKQPKLVEEFWEMDKLLRQMAFLFVSYSYVQGVQTVVTRILESVSLQKTNVHAFGRAIDFRDHFDGQWLYAESLRNEILQTFNAFFKRKDNRPTLYHHLGTDWHFHLQVPQFENVFVKNPWEQTEKLRKEILRMAIQDIQVKRAKEVDDVAKLLVDLVYDLRAKKDVSALMAENVAGLMAALADVDQVDDELRANRQVALATLGARLGELFDAILGGDQASKQSS